MQLVAAEASLVRGVVPREEPGPEAVFGHVVTTGNGRLWVDRRTSPQAVLAETGQNFVLRGSPAHVDPAALRPIVRGFLDCPEDFTAVVAAAFPEHVVWPRVVHVLRGTPAAPQLTGTAVRRLTPADERAVSGLHPDNAWISRTWGGPAGLVASGRAWGAFADERLVSVSCVFFAGERMDEIGVVTEPDYRGRGLSTACAQALCSQSLSMGRTPVWTTSPDNGASLRLAAKLRFSRVRTDRLRVVGIEVPAV